MLLIPRRTFLKGVSLVAAPAIIRPARAQMIGEGLWKKGGGAAFNPVSLVGTQGGFWTAAAGLGLSGADVTSWTDQSAHALVLNTSTTAAPVFSATGFNTSFPGVAFASASSRNLYGSVSVINSTTMSIFVLQIYTNGGPTNGRFVSICDTSLGADSTTPQICFFGDRVGNAGQAGPYSNAYLNLVTYTSGSPFSFGYIFDAVNATPYGGFTVGTSQAFSASLGPASNQIVDFGGSLGAYGNCVLAYVLITNNVLSAGDRTNLKTWTNANWGTSF